MTDIPAGDLKLRDMLCERARLGLEPVVLHVPLADHAYLLSRLAHLGVPEVAFRMVVAEPERPLIEPRISPAALAVLAFASNAVAENTPPTPLSDGVNAAADAMLGAYRHNDPAAAARIRAERQQRRGGKP